MPRGPGPWPAAPSDYLTRAETLEILRIKLQTLYAYVSRGWIQSVPHGPKGRRLYARQDVERMKARADARGGHASVAAGAMRWGEPIIQSTITEITLRGPCYRGVPALDLVRETRTFEQVAEHLWATGIAGGPPWRPCLRTMRFADALALSGRIDPGREVVRFLADVALSSGHASHRVPVTTDVLLSEARRLIATMAGCLSHLQRPPAARSLPRSGGVAAMLLSALGVLPTPDKVAAIDAALILCTDHELAQSTFVARIAASAGADLGECVGAAILTQTGMTAARSYERAEDFLRSCRTPAQTRRLFDAACEGNRNPPGFNHPLYPAGDPRAACLVEVARRLATPSPAAEPLYLALETAARFGCQPSLEAGLIFLAVALGLPSRSPCGLFIVGRTAGWVAHVMEQRLSGVLLRPRARYAPGAAAALTQH
jgi:citrate synthase